MAPAASLMVSTHEQPRQLHLVLTGLSRQSLRDFEIWVCDDGSGPETRAVVEDFRRRGPMQVTHVWQPHDGFRKSRILNQGIRDSTAPLVVFLDGDCVPHQDFIRDHVREWEAGTYLTGRRVELGRDFSAALTPDDVARGRLDRPGLGLWWSALAGGTRWVHRSVRLSSLPVRRLLGRRAPRGLMGSNWSVARADLITVNGYDEAFEGYGYEDVELEVRLRRAGLRPKPLRWLGLQFHLWHEKRADTAHNRNRYLTALASTAVRCEQGLTIGST